MLNSEIFFDVPLILTVLTLISGALAAIDRLCSGKNHPSKPGTLGLLGEYARSFFPVFLIVLLIRSFLLQPYRVPTGSLEPTILPGDFIVANQYAYGLRLPVLNKKILAIGAPQRGDIALFRYPVDPKIIFVKRVIGLPGDHIIYRNKRLTINGQEMKQTDLGPAIEVSSGFYNVAQAKIEQLGQRKHQIFIKPGIKEQEEIELIVPPDAYFMMGDNRDNSNDSRAWGLVPEKNLIAKAFGIWMSWDSLHKGIRWNRIGQKVV